MERDFLTDSLEESEDYSSGSRSDHGSLQAAVPGRRSLLRMNTRLVVLVGDGPDRDRLKGRATSNGEFVGCSRLERGIGAEHDYSRRSFASNTATPLRQPSDKKALAHSGQAACH